MPGHVAARPVAVVITTHRTSWCIETKSLKLYLWGFRQRPIFAEALAAEIADEVMATARLAGCASS